MRESKVYISPEVKQEIAYSFGSYDSFRRMLGNKLKVTVTDTSAVPLDVFWRELSENRPEMFDADTNYLDMPSKLNSQKYNKSIEGATPMRRPPSLAADKLS